MDEKKDGIIIDPYCGSGTTLVAAKILGYHYIGIDNSKEYVEYTKTRLKNYENEIPKAKEELLKHVVTKTFKERKERGEFVGKYRKNGKTGKTDAITLF
jgi:modification methylase